MAPPGSGGMKRSTLVERQATRGRPDGPAGTPTATSRRQVGRLFDAQQLLEARRRPSTGALIQQAP